LSLQRSKTLIKGVKLLKHAVVSFAVTDEALEHSLKENKETDEGEQSAGGATGSGVSSESENWVTFAPCKSG